MTQATVYPRNKEPYQTIQTKNFQQLQLQLWDALDNPDRTYIDMFAIYLYKQMVDFESYWEQEARSLQSEVDDLEWEVESLKDATDADYIERNRLENKIDSLEEENEQLAKELNRLTRK